MANTFSIYNYKQLSDPMRVDFDKALAKRLSAMLMDIKADEVLGAIGVEEFVASEGDVKNSVSLITDLYSKISAGIQVGSGNQNLFHAVLSSFTESWKHINKKK